MLRLHADDPDPASIGHSYSLILEGPLEVELLRTSLATCVRRHSIFRTRYEEIDGEFHQFVLPEERVSPFELEVSEHAIPEEDSDRELHSMIQALRAKPFDLETGTTCVRSPASATCSSCSCITSCSTVALRCSTRSWASITTSSPRAPRS
jgi:hypothetical protein